MGGIAHVRTGGYLSLAGEPETRSFIAAVTRGTSVCRGILGPMGAQNGGVVPGRLLRGIVLRVQEDACQIVAHGQPRLVRYAKSVPSPRTERISPGHLVAVATTADGSELVIWRWYDAVVLGPDGGGDPVVGAVARRSRGAASPAGRLRPPGTRAYLSVACPALTGGRRPRRDQGRRRRCGAGRGRAVLR